MAADNFSNKRWAKRIIRVYDLRIIHPDLTYDDAINHIDQTLRLQLNNIEHPLVSMLSAKIDGLNVTYLSHDDSKSIEDLLDSIDWSITGSF